MVLDKGLFTHIERHLFANDRKRHSCQASTMQNDSALKALRKIMMRGKVKNRPGERFWKWVVTYNI